MVAFDGDLVLFVFVCNVRLAHIDELTTAQNTTGKYPFMVFLFIYDGNGSSCVGTLIDRRLILTAAHCLHNANDVEVGLGSRIPFLLSYKVPKSMFLIHEDYDKHTLNNDIALIYLDYNVPIDETIKVALPFEKNTSENKDISLVVLGWALNTTAGFNDVLLSKEVTIIDISECSKVGNVHLDANNNICAVGNGLVQPCVGDSGGPLLSGNVQIGIVSRGSENCNGPVVYTRVEKYLNWILENKVSPEESNIIENWVHTVQFDVAIWTAIILYVTINIFVVYQISKRLHFRIQTI